MEYLIIEFTKIRHTMATYPMESYLVIGKNQEIE